MLELGDQELSFEDNSRKFLYLLVGDPPILEGTVDELRFGFLIFPVLNLKLASFCYIINTTDGCLDSFDIDASIILVDFIFELIEVGLILSCHAVLDFDKLGKCVSDSP